MAEQTDLGYIEKPQNEQVCSFFKKQIKNKNIRKRPIGQDEDDEESNGSTSVLSSGRKSSEADKLYFSTKRAASSDSVHESNDAIYNYESSKVIQVQTDNKATAALETETEFSRDATAIRERALKQAEEALKGKNKGSGDGTLYKGLNGYTDYKAVFRREQTIASEKAGGAHGPLRANAHIRVSSKFDYQTDICKDYKETGYCGYGDSCKFMHDRGDYKSGWQIEKEWEEAEKARKRNLAMGGWR